MSSLHIIAKKKNLGRRSGNSHMGSSKCAEIMYRLSPYFGRIVLQTGSLVFVPPGYDIYGEKDIKEKIQVLVPKVKDNSPV